MSNFNCLIVTDTYGDQVEVSMANSRVYIEVTGRDISMEYTISQARDLANVLLVLAREIEDNA